MAKSAISEKIASHATQKTHNSETNMDICTPVTVVEFALITLN